MSGFHARISLWQLSLIATLGSALSLQACSGRVQYSDCRSDSSCGGVAGTSGGTPEAGSAAVASSVGGSGAGPGVCENNRKDSDEADVDCGGSSKCERCTSASRCTANSDCESAFCANNRCKTPTCVDGAKNQDETAVDCGGVCPACDLGVACSANIDCSDEYCVQGVCADHCRSGTREADETDKDCGGTGCKACADKMHCSAASDCQSSVCSNTLCQPASCSDRVKNQDESDIDCGGVCSASKGCPVAARCITQADCASWICSAAGKCLADIVVPPGDVIDDFEDGDLILPDSPALAGRVGNWYTYGDGVGSSTFDPFAIERGASLTGLQVKGKGFTSWGSGLGVDLNHSSVGQSTKVPFDASSYAGITFWARAQSTMTVKVVLPNADTDAAGNTCTTCGHHYSKDVQVTPNWQRFTVAFSELVLEPGTVPMPTAFKPSTLLSLTFNLAPNQDYALYFDDVAFVKN